MTVYSLLYHTLLLMNIASAGLVTGGAAVMAAAYLPLLAELSQQDTITVHQGIGRYIDRWQPKLAIIAMITGFAELLFIKQPWQMVCILLGIIGIFGLSIISHMVSVPLSRKIIAWIPATNDAHLRLMKTQWIQVHYLRSACALVGFLFYIVSVLLLIQF